MKTIPLTQGYVALVDDADFERLMMRRWKIMIHKTKNHTGYYAVHTKKIAGKSTCVYMHREILGCHENVDHRDNDGLNNQRYNLRPSSQSQNRANSRHNGGSSPFKGVCWDNARQSWMAYIKKDRKMRNLGHFKEETDAAQVYNFAALELFGEFAKFNEPIQETA